ncbi:MAG: hypothetical protein LBE36_13865 [Flavobacteriaceae bacterium]|nr:hypothetical protein [Flavobacteriaceae bacterium]
MNKEFHRFALLKNIRNYTYFYTKQNWTSEEYSVEKAEGAVQIMAAASGVDENSTLKGQIIVSKRSNFSRGNAFGTSGLHTSLVEV